MQETNENSQQVLIEPERVLPDFTFEQLPAPMREPLIAMGWRTPMPVQAKAIPYLLDKRDMIVQSRTGSGKTGAFLMPLLMRIDTARRYPQALVLIPTRELAMQVFKELETLSQGMPVSSALLYGGVGYGTQLQALREGAQVIIGTPGRVLDHIGRRSLNLDRLSIIVFDEADEMLSMGFYPDMRELRRYLPRERSSWMFSATMPYKVQMLAREFLREPEFLSLSAGNVGVSTMEHRYYDVPPLEKDLMLMRLIEFEHPDSAIVFCNTKVDVEYLTTVLRNYGYNVEQLSGDLDQKSRERAMESIRRGETKFLVATDVAARGIDISDLSHVFQYDVPKDPDSYIHRAGRTARAGNTGVVITLVANMSEKSDLKKISRKYNVDFVEMTMPTQEELETRMAERLVVVLEDRHRTLSRLSRERMKRFNSFVQSLAENDEERVLLAMLLDDVYQTTYHQVVPSEPPPSKPAAPRPSAPPSAPRPSVPPPAAPVAGERTQQERSHGAEESGAPEQLSEEEPRKKKRRRKKKKNRGGGGEHQGSTQQPAGAAAPATERTGDAGVSRDEADRTQRRGDGSSREARSHEPERRAESAPSGSPRKEETRSEQPSRAPQRVEERPGRKQRKGEETAQEAMDFGMRGGSLVESIEVIEPDMPAPASEPRQSTGAAAPKNTGKKESSSPATAEKQEPTAEAQPATEAAPKRTSRGRKGVADTDAPAPAETTPTGTKKRAAVKETTASSEAPTKAKRGTKAAEEPAEKAPDASKPARSRKKAGDEEAPAPRKRGKA